MSEDDEEVLTLPQQVAQVVQILRETPSYFTREQLIQQDALVARKLNTIRQRMTEARNGEWQYSDSATVFGDPCALCSRSVRKPFILCTICEGKLATLKARLAHTIGLVPDIRKEDV